MGVQYCKWDFKKRAACNDAFGVGLAAKWFGMDEAAVEKACGRFVRGNNKGKLRGWIIWMKCNVGGWCRSIGGVIKPGMTFAHFYKTYEDMAKGENMTFEDWMRGAKRVDTVYGHTVDVRPADVIEREWHVNRAKENLQRAIVEAQDILTVYQNQEPAQPVAVQTLTRYLTQLQETAKGTDDTILYWFREGSRGMATPQQALKSVSQQGETHTAGDSHGSQAATES